MKFSWLIHLLGWLPLPLLLTLAGVLVWRKAYREFSVFFVYVVVVTLSTAVRLGVYRIGYATYYFVYWISDLLLSLMVVAVIYDLFARRLFVGYHVVKFYRYAAVVAVLIGAGLTVAVLETPNKATVFPIASRILSTVQVGLLAFFGGLMILFGRSFRRYEIGIALGFALHQSVQLAAALFQQKLRYYSTIVDQFSVWAFDLACMIWLISCWKAPGNSELLDIPLEPEMLEEAKRWERQFKDWLSKRRCV